MNSILISDMIAPNKLFDLGELTEIRPFDQWNSFFIDSFKVSGYTKSYKSAIVRYYKHNLPYCTEKKRLQFYKSGDVIIKVCNKRYAIGKWQYA